MAVIKHFCATNDVCGNPRRIFVFFSDGEAIAAWDEGYSGHHAVPGPWRQQAYNAERIKCTVKEYRQWRKLPSPDWACEVKGYSHLR